MKIKISLLFTIVAVLILSSCSSLLKYKKAKDDFKNAEFEKKVVIVETEEQKPVAPEILDAVVSQTQIVSGTTLALVKPELEVKKTTIVPAVKNIKVKKLKEVKLKDNSQNQVVSLKRQPEIEDSVGFNNLRRPVVDPFRVGETVIHDVSYLGATAGTIKFKINPYAVVNGRKSYNFNIYLKSNSFFSRVFAVDDHVQTFVDYEKLVPHVFKLDIRDSGQVKEAQSYFDNETLKADYWEHRYTEKNGHEEKKLSWSILPYSQNPFSAIFYMRIFNYVIGKDYVFRVADDEKNVTFKARVVEKLTLKTEAGEFKATKLKAEVHSRGNLAKASDFYIWVSDDDRKYILRIEVKLPFGSVVSEVTEIIEGKP